MLSWTLTFLMVAVVAGILGFTGMAGTAYWITMVLFVTSLVLALVSLLTDRRKRSLQ